MHKSTSEYVFWKINPSNGTQRGIGGENRNEGDSFLMKNKDMFFCMD